MDATLLNPNWGAEVVAHQVAATRALLQGLGPVRWAFLKIIAEFLQSDTESEEMLRQSLAAVTSGSYGRGLFNFVTPVYAFSSSYAW